jgi:PAS domain S-box-containing protein
VNNVSTPYQFLLITAACAVAALCVRSLIGGTIRRRAPEGADCVSDEAIIIRNAPFAIIEIDANNVVLSANTATARMFGYDEKEVVGQPLNAILPDFDATLVDQRTFGLTKEATRIDVATAISDSVVDGRLLRVAYIRDLTEEQRAKEALAESEAQLRLIIDTVPAILWVSRSDGEPAFINKRMADYTGVTSQDLPEGAGGPEWKTAVHPDDLDVAYSAWLVSLKTGQSFMAEFRCLRHDGEYRWFQARSEALRDESGAIICWYGINVDIDEHRKAEEALRRSEANFKLIIDTIPALVWCATAQGGPLFINKRMLDFIGTSEEEIEKLSASNDAVPEPIYLWRDLMHPDDFEAALPIWRDCLLTGTTLNAEFRIRRFDGSYRWFHALGEPHRDDSGNIINWYGVDVDINESKHLEQQLNVAQRRLERASQISMVAELSASISHELSQPLTAVLSNGEACRNWLSIHPPNLERAQLAAEDIVRDGSKAAEIVRRVKALFQHAAPHKTELNLREVVSETLLLHTDRIERAAIAVDTEFDPSLRPLFADRIQIQQVFSNLIQNAVDAMEHKVKEKRVLSIRVHDQGLQSMRIEVQDTGCGMEDVEKVFDAFFTTKPKGMGVGLSVCHSIIESHGGRIWATSTIGTGTTIALVLPIG